MSDFAFHAQPVQVSHTVTAKSATAGPGAGGQSSCSESVLHTVQEALHTLFPPEHVHVHHTHTPASVGVYGPSVDAESFLEHCSEAGSDDRPPLGPGPVEGGRRSRMAQRVKTALRRAIPHEEAEVSDLAEAEAQAEAWIRTFLRLCVSAGRGLSLLTWGFVQVLWLVLTNRCRRPQHQGATQS